jgi:hypothetical protein
VTYYDGCARKELPRSLQWLAFLQYFHGAGAGMAHEWFTVGLGECYGWAEVREDGRLLLRPSVARRDTARELEATGEHVPLRRFVRLTREEFYGPAVQRNFAQAWSFAWFLLRTEEPRWKEIPPRYYFALRDAARRGARETPAGAAPENGGFTAEVEAAARAEALAAAFEGFDDAEWKRLEEAWLAAKR